MQPAGECTWRPMYERALGMMARAEYGKAADVLRVVALAAPSESDVWQALAICHDRRDQTDIGDALRALGRMLEKTQ
jgi:Flp pilus assembly protein TadD